MDLLLQFGFHAGVGKLGGRNGISRFIPFVQDLLDQPKSDDVAEVANGATHAALVGEVPLIPEV
jgi:hypothetical protein